MLILELTKEELFSEMKKLIDNGIKEAIQEININDTLVSQKEAQRLIGRKYVYIKSLIEKELIKSPDGKSISLNSIKKFLNQNKSKK